MTGEFSIRRILVALDAETEQPVALEAAAAVASRLRAELAALFVEDVSLLSLEEHPMARQIQLPTGFGTPIKRGAIQRELRILSAQAKRHLERVAERRQLEWSFDVARGHMLNEVTRVATDTDLVVVVCTGRRVTESYCLKSKAARFAHEIASTVLYIERGTPPPDSIVAVYDGSELAKKALDAARRFAVTIGSSITVLLVTDSRERAEELRESASEQLPGLRSVRFHRIGPDGAERLTAATERVLGDLVVVGADNPFVRADDVPKLVGSLGRAVLVVR